MAPLEDDPYGHLSFGNVWITQTDFPDLDHYVLHPGMEQSISDQSTGGTGTDSRVTHPTVVPNEKHNVYWSMTSAIEVVTLQCMEGHLKETRVICYSGMYDIGENKREVRKNCEGIQG